MPADYRTEFPDFVLGEGIVIPPGFEDTSWRNDACPTWRDPARGLGLFIDYIDPQDRELADATRFLLCRDDENLTIICESDDWQEILAAIAKAG